MKTLIGAFAFLTILPLPWPEPAQPGRIFAWFPLVGWSIGAVLFAAATGLQAAQPDVRAFALLVLWVLMTGGLHLDGFGDSCDGLLVTASPERRLAIMKDPQAGSWAVIGLCLLLLGKWVFLRAASPTALLVLPVLGRWNMVLAAYGFPYARRTESLGSYFREGLALPQVLIASLFGAAALSFAGILFGSRGLVVGMLSFVLLIAGGWWASSRLGGGLTGDVYGALCELTEFICLIALVG